MWECKGVGNIGTLAENETIFAICKHCVIIMGIDKKVSPLPQPL